MTGLMFIKASSLIFSVSSLWLNAETVFMTEIPLALSGTFFGLAEWKFHQADDTRKKIDNSLIREGKHFQQLQKDFHDDKKSGRNFRTAAFVSLGISAALLGAAAVFYF